MQTIGLTIVGVDASKVSGRALAGASMDAHNRFDAPEKVSPVPAKIEVAGERIGITLPPASVTTIEVEK
ncbi:hypothetical protein MFFC18_04550 [Mariniblastus fucicola]|uniref:Alpha-L-arabinofuranosidase C-terminal domain-containing protein n=2 Tax=Mariniblastus fucicola TaxID=980251 RepID=A0A5B9P600_9BACT|nr:hypothetical protein MFFC18_04550 [Mariniblastus fucicola]